MIRFKVFLGFIISFMLLISSRTGVMTDRSGSPLVNGSTCDGCHNGGSYQGNVSLNGLPAVIKANDTINLELLVTGTNARGAGFQIVALDNNTPQSYVGEWITGIGSKKSSTIGLTHDLPRGFINNQGGWSFQWVSPPSGGPFTFYYAVNLVNFNNATSGDNPVTGSTQVLLPVRFSKLKLENEGDHINIQWQAFDEINNEYFEVQKMSDEGKFITLGKIYNRKGIHVKYQFQDNMPHVGYNYYRIKQVDKNKEYSYSEVQSIEFNHNEVIVVYNPYSNTIKVQTNENVSEIKIFDTDGKEIISNRFLAEIDATYLKKGIYFVTAIINGTKKTEKIMLY